MWGTSKEDFRGRSRKKGINKKGFRKEDHWGNKKIFINLDFGPGTELPTFGNKCSCVMCFSKDVPGSPEGRTESTQADDMIGKAAWGR